MRLRSDRNKQGAGKRERERGTERGHITSEGGTEYKCENRSALDVFLRAENGPAQRAAAICDFVKIIEDKLIRLVGHVLRMNRSA